MLTKDYDKLTYWQNRVEPDKEWLCNYAHIKEFLDPWLEGGTWLHVGCGTSTLGVEIQDRHDNISVINIDYAQNVINYMQRRFPSHVFQCWDCVKEANVPFYDSSSPITGIIDKCLIDTLLTGYNEDDPLFQELFRKWEKLADKYIWISYSGNRLPFLMRVLREWELLHVVEIPGIEKNAPHVTYFMYILAKPQ